MTTLFAQPSSPSVEPDMGPAEAESDEEGRGITMTMEGAMEKNIPITMRFLIYFASFRLLLDCFVSKVLHYLAWVLLLYIKNFTTLTLVANKPSFALSILIGTSRGMLKGKWRSEKNVRKAFLDRFIIYIIWLAIVFILHRDSSPLALTRFNQFIWKTYESRTLFWGHCIIFRLYAFTDAGARLFLRSFGLMLRYFRFAGRIVRLTSSSLFFGFADWIWPRIPAICQFAGEIYWEFVQLHIETLGLMFVWDYIYMALRGERFFGDGYWDTGVSLHIACVVIVPHLFGLNRYSRSRRPNVQRPLEPLEYASINEEYTIRLLLIYPRHPEGPVKCGLFQTRLSSVPPFEAISYCWGSSERTEEISVNGRSVMVTSNALQVLKNRSSFWRPKLVWIDSICINQSNNEEKGQQVQLMKTIYSKAFAVYVVLVQNPQVADFREEAARIFGDWVHSFLRTDGYLADYVKETVGYAAASTAADVLEDLRLSYFQIGSNEFAVFMKFAAQARSWRMKTFREFLSNPWFKRIWVVQEVALPPSVRVMYGCVEIQWDYISDALTLLGYHSIIGTLVEEGEEIGSRRPPPAACVTFKIMGEIRRKVKNDDDRPLAELLSYCRQLEATDMRDKLFAIHGICKNLPGPEKLLRPAYDEGITLDMVFVDAAKCLVSEGDVARMLSESGCISATTSNDSRSTLRLPSWVPDWSQMQAATKLSFQSEGINYNAGGTEPMSAQIQMRSLFVEGYSFDTIQELGPLWDVSVHFPRDRFNQEILSELLQMFKSVYSLVMGSEHTKDPYPWVDNQPLGEAFWRTLIGNRTFTAYPAPSSMADDFAIYTSFLDDIDKDPSLVQISKAADPTQLRSIHRMSNFGHATMRCWVGRRICVTRKGFIGMVPPLSELGDEIVVFVGMQTPSVLRKGWVGEATKHQNIGECYIHGIMDGEMLEADIQKQMFELI